MPRRGVLAPQRVRTALILFPILCLTVSWSINGWEGGLFTREYSRNGSTHSECVQLVHGILRTMRILVVDDEELLADGIRRGLIAEGFAVDVAHNGIDGLWHARETAYDAIVLDLMMPKMNGWKVCSTLRAEGNWTPILMLTAKDGEWDQVEGLEGGADDYVTKPFSFAVLVARLRALIRRGVVERPVQLEAGDLRLDPATHQVWRGEALIDLTAREFSVLEYLMRRVGQVLTKQQLLVGVWDLAFDGDPNIVEVYIGHLRRKVDRPFGRAAIETLRGAGYRLAVNGG